jgi:GTP-binding protein HflX
VQDQLFSTLDPTTRRLDLGKGRSALLTDTVGFVRKLPHELVEAFRSTLEEVGDASVLLHIVDASHDPERQIAAVTTVLRDLELIEKPMVLALNKIDLLADVEIDKLRGVFPDAAFISAQAGRGIDELLSAIESELTKLRVEVEVLIPFDRGEMVARVHEIGEVLTEDYAEAGTRMVVRIPREVMSEFDDFVL